MSNETPTAATATVQPGTAAYAASLLTAGRTWNAVLGCSSLASLIRGLAREGYTVEQIDAILTAAGSPAKASVIRYRVIEALADDETLTGLKSYGAAAIRRRNGDGALPAEAVEFARATIAAVS